MASIVRRAGSKLLRLIERAADPGAIADRMQVYAKDVAGVTQLFGRASDGTISQITPAVKRELLPEAWGQQDVPAAQAATALGGTVSQLFDDYQAIRAGSLVGLNARFNANVTAGNATVVVTINGVATALTVVVAAVGSSGRATAVPGAIPYVAGDVIGATLATSAGFTPNGSLDIECSIEVDTGP